MANEIPVDRMTSARLRRIREKAEYGFAMLDYLAARGHEIDKETLETFATALAPPEGSNMAELEAAVYKSYVHLVTLLGGKASPESLYLSQQFEAVDQPNDDLEESQLRATLRQRINAMSLATVVFLILLIVSLGYAAVVTNLTQQYTKAVTERDFIKNNQFELTRFKDYSRPTLGDPTPEESQPGTPAANARKAKEERLDEIKNTIFQRLDGEIASIGNALSWLGVGVDEKTLTNAGADQIVALLQTYIHPFLAGGLGACLSVLRNINLGLEQGFLRFSFVRLFFMRICVGIVAGIVVGWLVGGAVDKTAISITPLALAFAAGYGVEIIFSFLDRIVATFRAEPRVPPDTTKPVVVGQPTTP